nr:polyketide synthase [uncultured Actinoplanes sp.]
MTDEPIAIIGMGARFGPAADVAALIALLRSGRDGITRGAEPVDLDGGRRTVTAWGLMSRRDAYDPYVTGFAGDPQHGALYEVLWAAVEDAGLRISEIGERTSLFAGAARTRAVPRGTFDEVYPVDPTFAATHFSYLHDLWGESLMVDATCATSLVTAHLAVQALRQDTCDYALAAGVSIHHDVDGSYTYAPRQILSPDGYCRPFDRRANGTVPGDGAGAVLLRRLGDALRDGDPIHAVIRSIAVDNDGRAKAGYTFPGIPGKVRVIRQALDRARVDPAELSYVECHGVGIPLNDVVETTAMAEAFGPDGGALPIGSVKATLGHCDAAAGVAALIKTVLSVENGELYATPNTAEPMDGLERGRLAIVPEGRPWPDGPRLAGVMSAGIGGTNSFAVIEEIR